MSSSSLDSETTGNHVCENIIPETTSLHHAPTNEQDIDIVRVEAVEECDENQVEMVTFPQRTGPQRFVMS